MVTEHNRQVRSGGITPLGIIAAFVTLSETVGGLAATLTEGAIQVAFTTFAVGFPLLVGAAFFLILWKRAYVLYPPQDFGSEVDVKQYVEAMRHQAIGTQDIVTLVRSSIQGALSSPEGRALISEVAAAPVTSATAALEKVSVALAERAVGQVQEAVLTVDIRAFASSSVSPNLVFPYNPEEDAFVFLSAVYFQISDHVPAFTYGKLWALVDVATDKFILPKGIDWSDNYALAHNGANVRQLGLAAGMRLRAVMLHDGLIGATPSRDRAPPNSGLQQAKPLGRSGARS